MYFIFGFAEWLSDGIIIQTSDREAMNPNVVKFSDILCVMNRQAIKLSIIALLLYVGSITVYVSQPERIYLEINKPESWTLWDYVACTMLALALGLTIAAIKLRKE